MKTRVLLLMAFVAIGTGCKGNGDATKDLSPNQIGQVGQLNDEYRSRSSLTFLDDSHELRNLRVVAGTDPRILSGRLRTWQGYRGSNYVIKVVIQGPYGERAVIRQFGKLVPRGNQSSLDLVMPNQIGAMVLVGELASVEEVSSNEQCAYIKINLAHAMIGETRLLLCEESYDDEDYDRDDRRRGRY